MDNLPLKFHHFGLVLKDPAVAMRFLEQLGYQNGEVIYDPLQNVNVIMSTHPNQPAVEIIYPAETEGPLDNLIKKHTELIYHICYEIENREQVLATLKNQNYRFVCVAPPKPAVLFQGKKVSFYKIIGFGLVEFIENDS